MYYQSWVCKIKKNIYMSISLLFLCAVILLILVLNWWYVLHLLGTISPEQHRANSGQIYELNNRISDTVLIDIRINPWYMRKDEFASITDKVEIAKFVQATKVYFYIDGVTIQPVIITFYKGDGTSETVSYDGYTFVYKSDMNIRVIASPEWNALVRKYVPADIFRLD